MADGVWRLVRRLVLGDGARDDETVTADLLRLRSESNWSFLALPHRRLRDRFIERLYQYAEKPFRISLIGALDEIPVSGGVDPIGQVPQWLFAFDAAGMALLRALAVLTTHPEHYVHALAETTELDRPQMRSYLRACMLESLRLWPTTPTILRDTTEDTEWRDGADRFRIAKGAALMIVAPAFHRDRELLPFADAFTPTSGWTGANSSIPNSCRSAPGRRNVLAATWCCLSPVRRWHICWRGCTSNFGQPRNRRRTSRFHSRSTISRWTSLCTLTRRRVQRLRSVAARAGPDPARPVSGPLVPGGAGHLPHRYRRARRRGAARGGVGREDRHIHQRRPHGAPVREGRRAARAGAARSAQLAGLRAADGLP
jgi:Cytochrome P450